MNKDSGEELDKDFDSFEKELESPEKLMAEEILSERRAKPHPAAPKSPAPAGKIPVFVSLTRYKELRLALRDMKSISFSMRRILEDLKQNRDGGTGLLHETVEALQRIDENIDKIKGVLRV